VDEAQADAIDWWMGIGWRLVEIDWLIDGNVDLLIDCLTIKGRIPVRNAPVKIRGELGAADPGLSEAWVLDSGWFRLAPHRWLLKMFVHLKGSQAGKGAAQRVASERNPPFWHQNLHK
jgi:hypothetical protein